MSKITIEEIKEIFNNINNRTCLTDKIFNFLTDQDEKIHELDKKLNEAISLLKEHHEDRHENDDYYDGEYDLFNETAEFVKC